MTSVQHIKMQGTATFLPQVHPYFKAELVLKARFGKCSVFLVEYGCEYVTAMCGPGKFRVTQSSPPICPVWPDGVEYGLDLSSEASGGQTSG